MAHDDTIVAISTPPGIGGIAVIRMSGKNSLTIADSIFRGGLSLQTLESHKVIYGRIIDFDKEEVIDESLVIIMHRPKTYTGEDTIEINCHGGIVPAQRILASCISAGARMAERGEFTKRAFLNGRLDLAQAEAVLDIVSARTKEGLKDALAQLDGQLSSRIKKLRDNLISILEKIELAIDFSEESLPSKEYEEIEEGITSSEDVITELICEGKRAGMIRDGLSAAIVGRPNVGKSSLLNALLLEERAIVTPLPGTTRDVIEGWVNVGGIPLKLYDTCGLEDAKNIVEAIGIEKTRETMKNTSFLLFIADSSVPLKREDEQIFSMVKEKPLIIVMNKVDLPKKLRISELMNGYHFSVCEVSAKEHTGIGQLNKEILALINRKELEVTGRMSERTRHLALLSKAKKDLLEVLDGTKEKRGLELIAINVKEAINSLKEIIGEVTSEEVLDKIFREFCIGK